MLHRLAELDPLVRGAYADFDYKRIFAALNAFMTIDLSAFYFDIRKDALYCDPYSSVTRKACLTVLDHLFRATVIRSRRCSASPPRSTARPRSGGRVSPPTEQLAACRKSGATTHSRRNGTSCATSAALSPARWNPERVGKRIAPAGSGAGGLCRR